MVVWPVFLLRSAATLASRTGFANPGLQETSWFYDDRHRVGFLAQVERWWTIGEILFIAENINNYSGSAGGICRSRVEGCIT